MRTTVICRDKNLLSQAKKVFGKELVVDAYICTYHYEHTSMDDAKLRLTKMKYLDGKLSEGSLHFDAKDIRLRFINGKLVDFTSSEWASISISDERTKTVEVEL